MRRVTVAEAVTFTRRAERLLTPEEREALIDFLAVNPTAGDLIEGTGGLRKVRFAGRGKGKSGGYRVITYFYDERLPLYTLLLYGKGEQADLTPEQRRQATALVAAIKATARGRAPR